jgi:hypothetical protein
MKYLLFFNGQPLLLCCVCCKIAIQDFVIGLHKKKEKFTVSPMGIPTEYNPSVFHRELKKIYGIVPLSPTDNNPSVFQEELQSNLRDCATITDGFTDVKYRWNHRRIYTHPEEHACLTRFRLHKYRRLYRRQIPTESPMDLHTSRSTRILTHVRMHKYRRIFCRIEKSGGIFKLFWCAFQLISDGITDET